MPVFPVSVRSRGVQTASTRCRHSPGEAENDSEHPCFEFGASSPLKAQGSLAGMTFSPPRYVILMLPNKATAWGMAPARVKCGQTTADSSSRTYAKSGTGEKRHDRYVSSPHHSESLVNQSYCLGGHPVMTEGNNASTDTRAEDLQSLPMGYHDLHALDAFGPTSAVDSYLLVLASVAKVDLDAKRPTEAPAAPLQHIIMAQYYGSVECPLPRLVKSCAHARFPKLLIKNKKAEKLSTPKKGLTLSGLCSEIDTQVTIRGAFTRPEPLPPLTLGLGWEHKMYSYYSGES